jgi:hypothetical protein
MLAPSASVRLNCIGPVFPSLSAFTRKPPSDGSCRYSSLAFACHHCCVASFSGSAVMFENTVGAAKQMLQKGVMANRSKIGPGRLDPTDSMAVVMAVWLRIRLKVVEISQ